MTLLLYLLTLSGLRCFNLLAALLFTEVLGCGMEVDFELVGLTSVVFRFLLPTSVIRILALPQVVGHTNSATILCQHYSAVRCLLRRLLYVDILVRAVTRLRLLQLILRLARRLLLQLLLRLIVAIRGHLV